MVVGAGRGAGTYRARVFRRVAPGRERVAAGRGRLLEDAEQGAGGRHVRNADRRGASETRLLFQFVARRRGLDRARAFGDGAATFDGSRGDVRRLARVQSDVPTRVVRDDSRRAK